MTTEARTLPDRYLPAWSSLVDQANRKRVSIAVHIREGTEIEDDGEVLRGTFDPVYTGRTGIPELLPTAKTFDDALLRLAGRLEAVPLPGPDALREALREHSRRLVRLRPKDVPKSGADFPLYRDFRDVVLPLAWDNLVDSVRVEALEDFVRKVGSADRGTAKGARNTLAALAEEARALVAPKEEARVSAARVAGAGDVVEEAP